MDSTSTSSPRLVEGLAEHAVIQVGPKDPEKFIWGYNGIPFCIQLHPTIYIYITNLLYIEPAIHIYWNMRGGYNQPYKNTMGMHGRGISWKGNTVYRTNMPPKRCRKSVSRMQKMMFPPPFPGVQAIFGIYLVVAI